MRGRLLLFPSLLLLTLASPAQAQPLPDPPQWIGAIGADPCLDITSVFDDPEAILIIANQCTVVASVSVEHTEDGSVVVHVVLDYAGVVVTIAILFAEYGQWYVAECATEPGRLPSVGPVREWDAACWGSPAWMD